MYFCSFFVTLLALALFLLWLFLCMISSCTQKDRWHSVLSNRESRKQTR